MTSKASGPAKKEKQREASSQHAAAGKIASAKRATNVKNLPTVRGTKDYTFKKKASSRHMCKLLF